VPTKRELQAENAKLKKLLKEHDELLRKAAIRANELQQLQDAKTRKPVS
jgi:hypothetical protein